MDLALLQAWLNSQQGLLWQGAPRLLHRSWKVKQVAKASWERLGPEPVPPSCHSVLLLIHYIIEFGEFSHSEIGMEKNPGLELVPSAAEEQAGHSEGRAREEDEGVWQLGKASLWCKGNTSLTQGAPGTEAAPKTCRMNKFWSTWFSGQISWEGRSGGLLLGDNQEQSTCSPGQDCSSPSLTTTSMRQTCTECGEGQERAAQGLTGGRRTEDGPRSPTVTPA